MSNLQIILIFVLFLPFFISVPLRAQMSFGADNNPTGNPIGGGAGYNDIITTGDYLVSTVNDLISAIGQATPGEIIYILPNSSIDLTGQPMIEIPPGVTLAGNRGYSGAVGPLIFTTNMDGEEYLFFVRDGVRITGLRIRGPDSDFSEITYPLSPFGSGSSEHTDARCLSIRGGDVRVDNCELSNFFRVGIDVQKNATRLTISHNYLHDNHAYPIFIAGESYMPIIIEANKIEWIWHAVAGTGDPGTGCEVRYNEIISKPIPDSWYSEGSHAIDMHPDDDIEDARGDLVAADSIIVHHNTFLNQSGTHPIIQNLEDAKIRGVPRYIARFYNNIFSNESPSAAVAYKESPGNLWVHDNLYGPNQDYLGIAKPTVPQILFTHPPGPDKEIPILDSDYIYIDIEINVLPTLSISEIIVQLNNDTIYKGSNSIDFQTLKIPKNSLDSNLPYQQLTISAIDNLGAIGMHKTVFDIPGNGGPEDLEIIYSGAIPSQKSVKLEADHSLLFQPGFQVELGAEFEGKLIFNN